MEKKYCFLYRQMEGRIIKRWKHHHIVVKAHKIGTALKKARTYMNSSAIIYGRFVEHKRRGN